MRIAILESGFMSHFNAEAPAGQRRKYSIVMYPAIHLKTGKMIYSV